jgi:hypothetical protein
VATTRMAPPTVLADAHKSEDIVTEQFENVDFEILMTQLTQPELAAVLGGKNLLHEKY